MARDTVENLCQKAQQAVAQGKNEQARQYFQQALGLVSDNPDVHYGLATVCFLLNDLPTSVHHFKEVTRLDPHRAGAYINLGAVCNRLEQYDEAIPYLRRGIQLDMNRAEGYYNLGLVYRRKGQFDMAIQAYREAVRVNPRMADAHYNIANIYREMGQFRSAIAHYRQALEIRPNWEKAYRGLKQTEQAMTEQGDYEPEQAREEPKKRAEPAALDPQRMVDPDVHGDILRAVHQYSIEVQEQTAKFLALLGGRGRACHQGVVDPPAQRRRQPADGGKLPSSNSKPPSRNSSPSRKTSRTGLRKSANRANGSSRHRMQG